MNMKLNVVLSTAIFCLWSASNLVAKEVSDDNNYYVVTGINYPVDERRDYRSRRDNQNRDSLISPDPEHITIDIVRSSDVQSDSNNNSATETDTITTSFTTKDIEYYLTDDELLFIRPGLEIEILNVVLPPDLQLEVTYSIKDAGGLPLDHEGIHTPGVVDMRFTLANIPMYEEQKVRLAYERISRDGTLTPQEPGVYTYKFDTVLNSNLDTTHTLVLGGRRDLRDYYLDRYVDNDLQDWVPSGMYDPVPRDIVTTETCNRCHDPLAEHGGRWLSPAACGQCHNPGLADDDVSYSLDVMVHRVHNELDGYPAEINECEVCHTGGTPTKNFPMVASPAAALVCDASGVGQTTLNWEYTSNVEIYVRSGSDSEGTLMTTGGPEGSYSTDKWVSDGTYFDLYDSDTKKLIQVVPVNATVLGCVSNAPGTYRGEPGVQHTNWMDHPSRAVCGSCHDYIDWETGEGHSDYNIVQPDDNTCGNCHLPYTGIEFDRSVRGAHLELYKSAQFPGVLVEFLDVTNTNPGERPTVTYSVRSKDARLVPSTMNRLRFTLSGPNDDWSFYLQEDVRSASVAVGDNWTYTFVEPLPADAEGSFTVSVEGRNIVLIDYGDEMEEERDLAENPLLAFEVTDEAPVWRRKVVDDYNCESCHSNLAFHGGNRHDPDFCGTCHMPLALDRDGEGTINLKYMVHSIHRGEDLENGFVTGGHDYSDVEYPGDLRNCEACHIDNSQQVPVAKGLLPTITLQAWWSPMLPNAAACLSCHDGDEAAVHAYVNTASFGESCGVCHGEGKPHSVDKVHAR